MLLSKSTAYGIRATLYLAIQNHGNYISISDMSKKLDISFHFLTKILQKLSATGLVESYRGPNGGVRLTKPGSEISLMDIVTVIEGPELLSGCGMGLPGCGFEKPCPLHDEWAQARDSIQKMLLETTLLDLAEKGKTERLRLTPNGGFSWE